jgi:PEP-CTERM motif
MIVKTLTAIGAALALCAIASSASAATFLFSFTSNDGADSASGTLQASANGDGTYTATSGTITSFGSVTDNGSGVLVADAAAPAPSLSPSGFFIYDDQLLPGQNPLITNNGLEFAVGGAEINIFSNGAGPGTYQLYNNNGNNVLGDFALTAGAVPEPANWALMLVGFGSMGVAMRSRRRTVAATA